MTPYELQILLWYKCEAEDHPRIPTFLNEGPDHWRRAFIALTTQYNLLKAVKGYPTYELTERGEVFVNGLCEIKLPEQKWVML